VSADSKRTLILLRHAKSDWPEDVPDHDRPLAKRGRHDAPAVGRWLRGHGYLPDTVVCSTAQRTRQTWDLVAAKLQTADPVVTFEPRAYGAGPHTLLYLARELPSATRIALLIGHNPGVSELASALAEAPISFPTAGVAVLEFDGDWADLTPGQASLAEFVVPANLHEGKL
jgi:phosphohistidine phosphatase